MAPAGPHGSRRRCAPPHHEGLAAISDWIIDAAARPTTSSPASWEDGRRRSASWMPSALASLYSKNAFFFGSNPNFYRGNDGVQAYFEGLPRWQSPSVQFTDVRTAQAAADVINVAGTASFIVEKDAEPLVGENHLGDRSRRRRVEDRQPSRLVEDAADRAVGARGGRLAAPANAAHGFCELGIFRRHRLVRLWLLRPVGLRQAFCRAARAVSWRW